MLSELTCQLLFVPFSGMYAVSKETKKLLTEDEFFNKCYVRPLFAPDRILDGADKEIDEASDSQEILQGEKQRIIELAKYYNDEYESFRSWVKGDNHHIFTITGDAGSGKSTFLNYLRYSSNRKKSDISWRIIDLQRAGDSISFLGRTIKITNFLTLNGKIVSCIINNILNCIFANTPNPQDEELPKVIDHLNMVFDGYMNNISLAFPPEEVRVFFNESVIAKKRAAGNSWGKDELREYAKAIERLLSKLANRGENTELRLQRFLNLYYTVLLSLDHTKKYIVAFDNIERFIGVDEIQNAQIEEFISSLSQIIINLRNHYKYFSSLKIAVFMRNTTEHMITLHDSDFISTLDLSGGFSIADIIENKINWYNDHDITHPMFDRVLSVLGKKSYDGCGMGSLQYKLGMLFNHNNRIILEFLSKVLYKNDRLISGYDNIIAEDTPLNRFAARSIILRLFLDELMSDNFFRHILTEDGEDPSSRLSYSRQILTILYNFHLYNHTEYMPYDLLIEKLFPDQEDNILRYYDPNNQHTREIIAQILFYMNYYNAQNREWLQFVDVQIVLSNVTIKVSDENAMYSLLENHHQDIKIRIMHGGIAYLKYIVHSFEYFSCRITKKTHLPLICTAPTSISDLEGITDIVHHPCIQVVNDVVADALDCIRTMTIRFEPRDETILYKTHQDDGGITHKDRIINSISGYISNFIEYLKQRFNNDVLAGNEVAKKVRDDIEQELEKAIRRLVNSNAAVPEGE